MLTNAPAPSLMDNLEFMAELEISQGLHSVAAPSAQLLDRVQEMEDGFVPGQPRLVGGAADPSPDDGEFEVRDRNAFQPAPIEDDDQDDDRSVTISARVAAFAVMASGLAGVGAAAIVFQGRLALLLQ